MSNEQRLQKVIAQSGLCSRRAAEKLIADGLVTVDGKVVTTAGTKVASSANVSVDGQSLKRRRQKRIIMHHKKRRCMCTRFDPQERTTVYSFLERGGEGLFSIGRLDYHTEGLLLFTNDGDIANDLLHPSKQIEKTYHVLVKDGLNRSQVAELRRGVRLEDGFFKPLHLEALNRFNLGGGDKKGQWLQVIISEGRNRIIRRFFESADFEILRLVRTGFANMNLEGLAAGKSRVLTAAEVNSLRNL